MDQYAWWNIYGSLLLMSVLPVFLLLAAGGVAYWPIAVAKCLYGPSARR